MAQAMMASPCMQKAALLSRSCASRMLPRQTNPSVRMKTAFSVRASENNVNGRAARSSQPSLPKLPALKSSVGNETKLLSSAVAVLPLLLAFTSAELPEGIQYVQSVSDFHISEAFIKTFYMAFVCVFSWGAVVFGSMNDAYYESEEYRGKGGNGTGFWQYERSEEEEEASREELWREELRKEIEEKMSEVKELQGEREKELV